MKKSSFLSMFAVSVSILASMFSSMASASIIAYEHSPGTTSNFISHHTTEGPVLADDFNPAVSGSVKRIDWWGSAASSTSWEITFHTDNNGEPNVDEPNVDDGFEGGVAQHLPVIASGLDQGDGLFFYSAAWNPMDMFIDAGTDYWFSVANITDGWTWALGNVAGPTIGSEVYDATESTGIRCANGGPHCGPWVSLADTDFAFRVHVPEPTTLVLMGLGLAGIGYQRHRGKKSA